MPRDLPISVLLFSPSFLAAVHQTQNEAPWCFLTPLSEAVPVLWYALMCLLPCQPTLGANVLHVLYGLRWMLTLMLQEHRPFMHILNNVTADRWDTFVKAFWRRVNGSGKKNWLKKQVRSRAMLRGWEEWEFVSVICTSLLTFCFDLCKLQSLFEVR